MNRIEIADISLDDFKKMLSQMADSAAQKAVEAIKKPSEYEEITIQKAAAELSCSERTVKRKIKNLGIRSFKIGKQIIIQRKDLSKIKKSSEILDR